MRIVTQRLDLLRDAGVPLHIQDARDYHALSHLLGQIRPQIIVHLAAVSHAALANKDPHSTFDHNLRTLENALDNARPGVLDVERFVFFSSSMVYGNFQTGTATEDMPCDPIGIYGALKLSGERMVIAYNQVFDLPYTIVRPSALYGERCVSRRVGQIFIENALRGAEITVQGDGADRLDFTYIQDVVHGVECILRSENAVNQVFNITYGQSRSLRELAETLQTYFPDLAVRCVPRDRLMPKRGTLSVDKAASLIGYDPQYPLEVGMEQYVNWYKEMTDALCAVG
jgi:nucleoside-diphosphate-sugar epimerase